MSDRETAIAMFRRKFGATSYHVTEDGDLILSRGSGKKLQELKVTASRLSQVEERVRTHETPFHYELQATLLGTKAKTRKGKSDRGKR
jgi:hypothetical protein